MSIFDKIKSAIFGHAAKANEATPTGSTTAEASAAAPAPDGSVTTPPVSTPTPASPAGHAGSGAPVDVAPILDAAAKKNGQKLDWRHSIVDLMKALGMDASMTERKQLADELGYDGDHNDSAKMNTWLHKALMKKLSENGGKVPAELMD